MGERLNNVITIMEGAPSAYRDFKKIYKGTGKILDRLALDSGRSLISSIMI